MSTDPVSEQESLYEMLFKVMGSDGNESELINRMKEESSIVISDDGRRIPQRRQSRARERSALVILRMARYEQRKEEERWMG